MRQFQTLVYLILYNLIGCKAFANCQEYVINGLVKDKGNKTVILVNPESRSETVVHFPSFMENTLKNDLGSRVQIEAPAEQIHRYSYKVYYHLGKVRYYPFSVGHKDSIKPKNDEKFSCE